MKNTALFCFFFLVTLFAQTNANNSLEKTRVEREQSIEKVRLEQRAFTQSRQAEFDRFKAQRDSAFSALIKNQWQTYLKVPNVSLPKSPDALSKSTAAIPQIAADENPDIAIIDALLNAGVSEEKSVKIALEIIDSLGIDGIQKGQVIGIAADESNPAKPVVVTYEINNRETIALLQTKSDDYVYKETIEKTIETFTLHRGAVGDSVSRKILSTLNAMANGTAKNGSQFSALVKNDGRGKTEIVAINHNGTKAFAFNDVRGGASNVFYTSSGAAVIKPRYSPPLGIRLRKTSGFGMRSHPILKREQKHLGVDYAAPLGTPVYAIADGVVIKSAFDRKMGNYVAIRHSDGLTSYYLHLRERGIKNGSDVTAGQVIGRVGSTGTSTGPHLHLGIKKNNEWQDSEKIWETMDARPQLSGDRLRLFNEQVQKYSVHFQS